MEDKFTLNKKLIFLVCVITLLLSCLSITTATDTNDINTTDTTITTTTEATHTTNNVQTKEIKNNKINSDLDTSNSVTTISIGEKNTSQTTTTTNNSTKNTTSTNLANNKEITENNTRKTIAKNSATAVKEATEITVTNFAELNTALRNNEGDFIINMEPGIYTSTNSIPLKASSVTIRGNGAIITSTHTNRIFISYSGSDIVLKTAFNISDLTFQNINKAGSSSGQGAAIIMGAGSNLTFTNVNFTNISSYFGGAIYVNGRTNVSFTNVIFNNVSSTTQGGAICLVQANTTFNNVTFNNTYTKGGGTDSNGGAVRIMTGNNVTFNNVIFNNTYAEGRGGAIEVQVSGCNVYIYNTTFNNCSTNTQGGLIWAQSGNITADNITVTNVTANDKGGAIYLYDGYAKMIVSNSTFINSNATNAGGLAYVWRSSNLKIINSSIENTTSDIGGFAVNYGTLNITDSNLTHINSTTSGGLVYNNNTTYIDGSKINNIESGIGGMVYHNASTNNGLLLINNSNISNIKSDTLGGLVYSLGNVNISNSNIDHVNATGDGGVLYLNGSSKRINVTNTNVTNVFSNSNGGFAYLNYTYTYLNLTDSEIINSTAVSGGLVYSKGNVNISNSNIDHVNSTGDGGVLYLNGTNQNTYVVNTNVTNVLSNSNGSFVYVAISTTNRNNINITGSRIVNASATNGGALYLTGSSKTNISFSSFENVSATIDGGMIYHETADDNTFNGSLSIDSSNMSYSSAGHDGGLVFSRGIMNISNSNIDHVNATRWGGVLHLARKLCRTNVTNTNVSNVFSGEKGGFAFVSSYTSNILNVTGCRIINSSAYEGGVFHIEGELNLKSTYIENTNASYGGVIRNQALSVWDNVTVINSSAIVGGVIFSKSQKVTVNNSVIKNVHATEWGGTLYNEGQNTTITNTNITNSSASVGGAVCNGYMWSYFIGNILQDSYVTNDEHFVIELIRNRSATSTSMHGLTVADSLFINNTDNARDMLLQRENTNLLKVRNNIYIDNFLEDSIVDVEDVYVTGEDKELQIKINLREVYNNTIVNGTFEVYDQDENLITTADVVNGLSDVTIPVDRLKSGQNDLAVKYVSLSKHYQPVETSLTVFKLLDTSITIEAPETLKVSEKTTINITLKDENGNNLSDQIIKVKIGDTEEEYTTDENGTVSIPDVSYSEIGEKPIIAVFDGTTEYVNSDLTTLIQVEQLETKINVTADTPIKFGTSTVINGTLIDEFEYELGEKLVNIKIVDADGNVIVDENVPTSDTGFYEFEFTNGTVGTCNVTVSYKGETNYEECNATYQVIVDKVETFINVTANDVKVGEETTITGTLVDEGEYPLQGVEVIIAIDGNTIGTATTSSDGTYTIKYNATSSGVKTITVRTADNSTNIGANNSTTFNVDKNPVTITVETSDVTVRNTTNITGTVSNATGTLSDVEVVLYVNGVEINKTRTNSTGGYNFEYDTFITGVNNVTVRFNGNDYYDYYEANGTFNVIKRNTTITVDDIANVTVGNNVTITGVLKDQFGEVIPNAIVTVNVNDILYTKITNSAGEYTVVYPTSLIGANTVTVTYNANDTFNESTGTLLFNVTKHEVNIDSELLQIKPGTSLIEVNVTDETNKNVIYGNIVIKDEEGNIVGSATVINGTVKTVVNTVPGEHTYTIEFTGPDEYEDATATITEDIPKYNSTIIPGVIGSTKINDTIIINGTLIDQDNNPIGPTKINITINNENVTVDVNEDGTFTYTNTTNVTGTTNITINYPGDENYNNTSISYNFTVNPLTTQLAVNATSPVVITNNTVIAGELKDENNQPISGEVEIWVNDELITTVSTDQDGKFSYTLTTDALGLNNVTVKYDGASDYYAVNASTNFFVDQMFTALNVSAVSPVKVGSNTTISGRLVDGRGNPVSGAVINITVGENDKYNVTTDPDGYYTLNVTGENAGDYKVKVYYNGTVALLGSNNTAKFIVEKRDVDIDVIVEELKAGNTTLNITLTDEDGNPIADQKINITDSLGNVIGTGKTDEEGNLVTNITVEPGKQQVIIVSEGTDKYLQENKTITLVVPEHETELELNDVEDTEVRGSTTITGTLKDAEGKPIPNVDVIIKVDGETFEVPTDGNGNYELEYNATSSGEKEVLVEFIDPDGKYKEISETTDFFVDSIDSKVTVGEVEDTKVGHNVTINGTLLDKNGEPIQKAEVIVSVNGVNHTVTTDENGTYSLVYVPSIVGTNNVSIIFDGDNNFNANTSNTTFTVAPIGTSITSEEKQHSNGVSVVELTVTDEDGNNVAYGPVYIEDEDGNIVANGSIVNGTLITTVPTQPGENNFKLVFNGTDKLANSTKDITINVPKYDTTIIPGVVSSTKINDTIVINGTLIDQYNNPVGPTKINITINNENVTVDVNEDGTFTYTNTTNVTGTTNITINYPGDNNYSNSSISYNFTVNPLTTQLAVNATGPVVITNNTVIAGELKDENGQPISGEVEIWVNGKLNTTVSTDHDGKFNYSLTTDILGLNNVTVKYDGASDYYAVNASTNFFVDQMFTALNVSAVSPVKVGSNTTISGRLVDGRGNPVSGAVINITVGESDKYNVTTDSDGYYTLNVTGDAVGDYKVKVYYNGTVALLGSNNTAKFIVEKRDVDIDVIVEELKAGNTTLNITLTDEDGNPIADQKINITDSLGNVIGTGKTDEEGNLVTNITVEPGKHSVTIVSEGTDKYLPENKTITLIVPEHETELELNDVEDTEVRGSTTITGTLKDAEGKPIPNVDVIIKVDGETFEVPTDGNGNYELEYNATSSGEKEVLVEFIDPDGKYKEISETTHFFVDSIDSKVNVGEVEDTKVGHNVTINGTLLDKNGEPIQKAEVIVSVNGVNHTVITDENGTYSLVYVPSTVGTNNVSIIYEGDNDFNNNTSNTTFTVAPIGTSITYEEKQHSNGVSVVELTVTDEDGTNVAYGPVYIEDEDGNIVANGSIVNGTLITTVPTQPGENNFKLVFNGTDKLANSTKDITINVPKYDSTIIPDSLPAIKVGEESTISGTIIDEFNNPVSGQKVNITVNGENYTVTTNPDGTYNLPFTADTAGENNITVTLIGDDDYSTQNVSYNFVVNPLTSQLTVNATSPVIITNTSVIAGELKDENNQPISGEVEIWVNDELITTVSTDQDGKFNYSLTTDALGLNNVTVKYSGASDYYAVNASTNFFVDQMFTALNVSAVSPVKVGSNTTISGRLVDGRGNPVSGAVINITVGENDKYNVTTDPDGYYTLNVTGENAGEYKVKVYYNGTVAFLESNNTAKFIVEKHDVDIDVTVEELKAGNTTLNIILTDEDGNPIADQEFNITDSSGNVIGTGKTDENGNLLTNITVEPGKQQVTIVSEGTDNYLPENKTITLTVPEYETELEVNDVEDTEVRGSTTITGTLKDAEGKPIPNANVTIKVDGKTFEVPTDNNGNYELEYNATSAGKKEVLIEFIDPEGKYKKISEPADFFVDSIDSKVNVDTIEDTKVGQNVTINGTLTDKNGEPIPNAEVIVSVNGVNHTVITDENGTYSLVYVPSTVGTNNVSIIYEGDNNFNNNTSNTTFTVAPIGTSITSEEKQNSNGVTVVELKVTDEDNNNIPYGPVYIEDENGNIVANGSIINGTLTTTIPTQPGENNFKIVFNGTDKLANSTKDITINVPKYDSTIIPDPIPAIKVGEETNISGTIVDEFNNPVSGQKVNITVNGENYTVTTNPDGTYNLPYTADKSGENNITVTLIGDDDYSTQNVSYNNVNVDKLATTTTVNTPTTVKAGTPATITGKVLDENNKPLSNAQITVKVGNETINTTTDKDGKYTVTTTPETTGKLPVTVNYEGDNTHKPTNNTGILLVDKLDTILTANVDNPVKLGSTESITGTLLDENNNVIPDADITVTVNGKAITTKTDSNGEYSIDYPTTTTGVNNVTVDYLGDDEHYPISTNRKFTVEELDVVVDVAMPNVEAGSSNLVANITDENGNKVSEGTVTITTPDGKQINATVKDGKVNVTVPTTPGKQTYTITYNGNDDYEPSTKTIKVDVPKVNTTLNVDSLTPSEVDTPTAVTGTLKDSNGKPVPNAEVTVTYANTTQTVKTDSEGKFTANIPEVRAGTNNVTVTYTGSDNYNSASNNTQQTVNKHSTIVTVDEVIGIIGEKITLTAHVTDANGNKVSGGNLVFKLNGKTLREDYRFDSNASALKFKVVDGKVTVTITADLYLRNVKNLTASYSGSYKYEANVSDVVTAQIQKRRAILNVTTVPTTVKQDKNIVFKAYLTDITKNAENKTSLSTNGTVVFKVNGNTIKDENGSQIHVDVVNNVASYVYYITPGTASVDKNGNLRNYSVEAVYDNPSFYPDTRNTTAYHVEKSSVNINIEKTTVKSNELSVKATFTDYNGNALVGENKICIKINGKTYQENGKPKYFTVQNGKVNLSGIKLEQGTKVKSVTIVTGERQSYHSARETTTDITY